MTDPDALERLAKRLEAGECGREIDRAVALATGWRRVTPSQARNKHGFWVAPGDWLGLPDRLAREEHRDPPAVSTDLTACEAFRERVLPGAYWEDLTEDSGKQSWSATLNRPFGAGDAPTEPAARLAATLRALAAKIREEDHA